jgi:hypothetical protein
MRCWPAVALNSVAHHCPSAYQSLLWGLLPVGESVSGRIAEVLGTGVGHGRRRRGGDSPQSADSGNEDREDPSSAFHGAARG